MMGLNRHGLAFLRRVANAKSLGEVATMGRQGLAVSKDELREIVGTDACYADYCERLLCQSYGATLVESFDYSDFEGATHLIDLNEPHVPERQYDTIIDAGTTEHIFNASEALRTMTKLCRVGGRMVHMLPSNNFCNHGFWQLSPELFISLYTEQNGFADTEVYLADYGEKSFWYHVTPPKDGNWPDNTSPRAMDVLVVSTKVREVDKFRVQQGQYAESWDHPREAPAPWSGRRQQFKRAIEGTPLFTALRYVNRITKPADYALRANPYLKKVNLRDMVS